MLKKIYCVFSGPKNDILFYVVYFSVAKKLGKPVIELFDIKGLDLNFFTDEYITSAASEVFNEYEKLGGNGKVAKGSDLIDALIGKLAN